MDLYSLNDMQRKAVCTTEGPLLVLAGAGSGKTRVLTYRIAYLVKECNVKPWNILALTFTNKAAKEMREREELLVGDAAREMWITTFHSCCAKLLRFEADKLGYDRSFTIYDDSDKKAILKAILAKFEVDEKVLSKNTVSSRISDAKNSSLSPIDVLQDDPENGKLLSQIFIAYSDAMRAANAFDFDDLILMTLRLFNERPDVLEHYRQRFRYVLVDEYQDTNMPQYELVRQLCCEHMNICVVGDDDQSIYGWRGADIRNILEFESDFPGAAVIRLEQNYRSTENILQAANAVIENNSARKGKKLWTSMGTGDSIEHYYAADDHDEANFVCKTILKNMRAGASYADHCVLYRTNAQSRLLESAMSSYGLRYRVCGGVRFFDRMEVRDIVAYLRLIVNNDDDAAFRRIVNVPARAIGQASVDALAKVAFENSVSLLSAIRTPAILAELPPRTAAKFAPFRDLINELLRMRESSTYAAVKLTDDVIRLSGYMSYLASYDAEFDARKQNVQELIAAISEVEESVSEEDDALSMFLENAALIADVDSFDASEDAVVLMTLHSAKGLEFHTVFIVGMEEELFPTSRSIGDIEKLEEERRLCYVGITRAKRRLYLINAARRRVYNQTITPRESRFLDEIPDFLIMNTGLTSTSKGYAMDTGYSGYNKNKPAQFAASTSKPAQYAASTSKPAPLSPRSAALPQKKAPRRDIPKLETGVRVCHEVFGKGRVKELSGGGAATVVTICFDSGETKKFAAQFAPITLADE